MLTIPSFGLIGSGAPHNHLVVGHEIGDDVRVEHLAHETIRFLERHTHKKGNEEHKELLSHPQHALPVVQY